VFDHTMRIDGFSTFRLPDLGSALQVRRAQSPKLDATAELASRSMRDFARVLTQLRTKLSDLEGASSTRSTPNTAARSVSTLFEVPGFAGAASTGNLGLDPTQTATTLRSTQEVNTTATSYTPFQPGFTGASTAGVTLTGTYNGSQGDNTLRLVSRDTRVVGTGNIRFRVYNAADQQIEQITFSSSVSSITLGVGITVSLAAGTVINGDEFSFNVSTSVGSAVNPDNPFNGTGNNRPNFEPGLAVNQGAFTLNGVSIAVLANDTLNGIVAKINASAAGVTAAFNAGTERIELTQRTLGSAGRIQLSGDTSGFLAATKLAAAVESRGIDHEVDQPIAQVSKLAGVQNGSFAINGVGFTVTRSTDSLSALLTRINESTAGVTASYDAATGKVALAANTAGAPLVLDNGTSSFLTGVQITAGTIAAPITTETGTRRVVQSAAPGVRFVAPDRVEEQLGEVAKLVQASLSLAAADGLGRIGSDARDQISAVLRGAFGVQGTDQEQFGAFGITVDLRRGSERFTVDAEALGNAIRERAGQMNRFLQTASGDRERRASPTNSATRSTDCCATWRCNSATTPVAAS
jgi:hypothetical protein